MMVICNVDSYFAAGTTFLVNDCAQENHNIFSRLNPDEYRQVLGNMKHCILATDLALFFPNKAKLSQIVEGDQFDWESPEHRLLVQTLIMTGSDLCASAKPWKKQLSTVAVIYEEFYRQGDFERRAGRDPVPIMNRFQEDEQVILCMMWSVSDLLVSIDTLYSFIRSVCPLLCEM